MLSARPDNDALSLTTHATYAAEARIDCVGADAFVPPAEAKRGVFDAMHRIERGVQCQVLTRPGAELPRCDPQRLQNQARLGSGCAGVLGVVVFRLRYVALAVEGYVARIEIHSVGGE